MKCAECQKSNAEYQCTECGMYYCAECADDNMMHCDHGHWYQNIEPIQKSKDKLVIGLTYKLKKLGVADNIVIHKGSKGYYLYNTKMKHGQYVTSYKCVEDCIASAKRQEFPRSTYIGALSEWKV